MLTLRVFTLGAALVVCLAAGFSPARAADTADGDWSRWLQRQLADLPADRALQARVESELADSRALSEPLYNPELVIGYEHSAETTKTVGVSQTLDWSGKGRAAGAVGDLASTLARLRGDKARSRLRADALQALVSYSAARARLNAAREQEQRLTRLTELVRRRECSGDLGQVDATLAYLSLGRTQQALADAESAATEATTRLRRILAVTAPARPLPDADQWRPLDGPASVPSRLDHNFDLRLAELQLSLAGRGVDLARKQRNTDPTLGVRAGREGDATLWGLDFSLPLPLFNSGEPEYRAALAGVDQRRALLEKTRNDIRAELDGALTDYRQRRDRWRNWQRLTGDSLAGADRLLERVWSLGELTTQDYLQGLDQGLQARLSGIALRAAMQRAWVRWLYQSAGLDQWLNQLAGRTGPVTPAQGDTQ
jgi:outer membrane protein, heavy metal efflux system